MATVERFEDLVCWQKARELVREVYRAFKGLNDYGFKDQIQRASVSVMSNIAEGFESGTQQEFVNYLYIAKGSAGEVRAQLYAAYDVGYLDVSRFQSLRGLAEECSRLIARFIRGVKGSRFQGLQYKREESRAGREQREFQEYLVWYGEEVKKNSELEVSEDGLKEFIRLRNSGGLKI